MTPQAYADATFDKMAFSVAIQAIGIPITRQGDYLAAYSLARGLDPTLAKARLARLGLPADALDIEPPPIRAKRSFLEGKWRVYACVIGDVHCECIVPEHTEEIV